MDTREYESIDKLRRGAAAEFKLKCAPHQRHRTFFTGRPALPAPSGLIGYWTLAAYYAHSLGVLTRACISR